MNKFIIDCIDVILSNEGGFQRDIDDYGNWNKIHNKDCEFLLRYTSKRCRECQKCLIGTNKGIAARYFAHKYDIKTLTLSEAKSIYYHYFWTPQNVVYLITPDNEEFILQLFDFGVNTTIRHSNKTLQRIVGAVPDGYIGKETLKKVKAYHGDLLKGFKDAREKWYEYISKKRNNQKFLDGWIDRIKLTHF